MAMGKRAKSAGGLNLGGKGRLDKDTGEGCWWRKGGKGGKGNWREESCLMRSANARL